MLLFHMSANLKLILTEMNKNSIVSIFESYFLSFSVHIFRNWIVQYLNNKSTITILLEKEKNDIIRHEEASISHVG